MSFLTSTPRFCNSHFSTWPTKAEQPPQLVAALVQDFNSPSSITPPSMASHKSCLVTLLQEQITAPIGKASTPKPAGLLPSLAGKINASGFSGKVISLSLSCNKSPYASTSPTNTAPNNFLPSLDTTNFL